MIMFLITNPFPSCPFLPYTSKAIKTPQWGGEVYIDGHNWQVILEWHEMLEKATNFQCLKIFFLVGKRKYGDCAERRVSHLP